LVPFNTVGTNGVIAHCLEIHDLWISKAIAGRPKDLEFCAALLERPRGYRQGASCGPPTARIESFSPVISQRTSTVGMTPAA